MKGLRNGKGPPSINIPVLTEPRLILTVTRIWLWVRIALNQINIAEDPKELILKKVEGIVGIK